MRSKLLALLAAALVAACGGSSAPAPAGPMAPLPPLGWWGISPYDLPAAPGAIAVISDPAAIATAGRPVWFMVWALTGGGGALTTPGWEQRLDALVAARGGQVACWYLADEPTAWGYSTEALSTVASHLPAGSCVVMSISPDDLAAGFVPPPAVTRLGLNFYASRGASPDSVPGKLDQAAAYGRELYLSLDVTANPDASGSCAHVTAAQQQASIAVDEAQLRWAYGKPQVKAAVAFIWRSEPPAVCGALDMPITAAWVAAQAASSPSN